MNYKFLSQDQKIVGIVDDDGLIRVSFIAGGNDEIHEEFNDWLAEGNTPEPADPPPPPSPEWKEFLQDLRQTTVFTLLRAQSRVDIEANALATELRTELGEAALGISTSGNIQPLLDDLAVGLTTSQKQEISDLIDIHYIPLTISVGIAST